MSKMIGRESGTLSRQWESPSFSRWNLKNGGQTFVGKQRPPVFMWEWELPSELGRKQLTELAFRTSGPVPGCGMNAKQVYPFLQFLKAFAMC